MATPSAPIDKATLEMRLVRTLHLALVVSVCLYFVVIGLAVRSPGPLRSTGFYIIVAAVVALVLAIIAVFQNVFQPAVQQVRADPEDGKAWARWRFGLILTYVLTEAIALAGLIAAFLGATKTQWASLVGASLALMLLETPRRP